MTAFTPKSFNTVIYVQGDWDNHIAQQKDWLFNGMCHFNTCAVILASQIDEMSELAKFAIGDELEKIKAKLKRLETSKFFCLGMARQMENGWYRVDQGQNPFAHAGRVELEEQPESACSGQNCELKEAGIDLAEIDAKKAG